jgi:hypothetical protein
MPKRMNGQTILESILHDLNYYGNTEGANEQASVIALKIWNNQGALPREILGKAIEEMMEKERQRKIASEWDKKMDEKKPPVFSFIV